MIAITTPSGLARTRTLHGFATISSHRSDSRRTTLTAHEGFAAASGVCRRELVDQALDIAPHGGVHAGGADAPGWLRSRTARERVAGDAHASARSAVPSLSGH